MDTHADLSCAGMDAYILERLDGRLCEVRGFHDSYNSLTNVEYVNSIVPGVVKNAVLALFTTPIFDKKS